MATDFFIRSMAIGWRLLRRFFDSVAGQRDSDAQMAPAVEENVGRICARSRAWPFDRPARLLLSRMLLGKADDFVVGSPLQRKSERAHGSADRFSASADSIDRGGGEPRDFRFPDVAAEA